MSAESKFDPAIADEVEREVRRNYEAGLVTAREWLDELCSLIQCGDFQAAEDWVAANAVTEEIEQ
jgi:hypothetical protein